MTHIRSLAAAMTLIACDPTTTATPTTTGGGVAIQDNTAACGSIAPIATATSSDLDAPAVFEVGDIVEGRIDPDATTNFRHFWDVDLGRGTYHLVLDNYVADGSTTNAGLEIQRLDAAGVEQERLVRGNEVDHRSRLHTVVTVGAATTLRMEVTPVFGIEDYLLGIFENATPVPSPFFDDCPATTPIELGVPLDLALPAEDLDDADELWLTFDADAGDYTFTVDADQVSGTSTNLQYEIGVVDRFGQVSRYERVLLANEVDVSARLVGNLIVGEAASYWMRVVNLHEALDLTVMMTQD